MLLAIDPGVNQCGLAVLDTEQKVVVKETVLVKNARKFTPEEKIIEEMPKLVFQFTNVKEQ